MADRLQLEGANPYRVRAYRKAAANIDQWKESVVQMADEGRLREIPGVGKDLEKKVRLLLAPVPVPDPFEDKAEDITINPDWLRLPGLDPGTAKILQKRFHLESLRDLELLARSRYLRTIPEFGARLERSILKELEGLEK